MVNGIIRMRWWILAAWLACAAALVVFSPRSNPALYEPSSFLPAGVPSRQASDALHEAFPAEAGYAQAMVIFERVGAPLTRTDLAAMEDVAARIVAGSPGGPPGLLRGVKVLSPAMIPLPDNPLISPATEQGQAALIRVTVPTSFITIHSIKVVDHIRAVLLQANLEQRGLRAAVSGSAGFGSDYAAAVEESHHRAVLVTVTAVAVILGLVYRAPLAAMLPLAAISLAAIVAVNILSLLQRAGLHTGTAEGIFVVVLIYGAGVDYALLLTGRYREFLSLAPGEEPATSPAKAAALSLHSSIGAIAAAAGTNILGMLMLMVAHHVILRSTGPAVAVALGTALLATVTLVPALMAILGKKLFWPTGHMTQIGAKRLWPAVAGVVTARPLIVMLITLAVLLIPTVRGARLTWVYDALSSLDARWTDGLGNSVAGSQIASRYWPVGEIAPVQILVVLSEPMSVDRWRSISDRLTQVLLDLRTSGVPVNQPVQNVRSLVRPLGRQAATQPQTRRGLAAGLLDPLQALANQLYLGANHRATRLEAVLAVQPFSLPAMSAVEEIRRQVQSALQAEPAQGVDGRSISTHVYIGGSTAEMIDIRNVTRADFQRIAVLVLCVILVVVTILLRDVLLAAFMLACTVLSYFATLGLSYWFFAAVASLFHLPAYAGLDWKVEVFLFVVIVAVGQDYTIFLMGRLMQEARRLPPRAAAREALIHTGPVISSCGLIMAATLGSLAAGRLVLLVQLGFALALGMLIDTFLVRPLLLPAFVALTGRTGKPLRLLH